MTDWRIRQEVLAELDEIGIRFGPRPAQPSPTCPKCGRDLVYVEAMLDPRFVRGKCPEHRRAWVTVRV